MAEITDELSRTKLHLACSIEKRIYDLIMSEVREGSKVHRKKIEALIDTMMYDIRTLLENGSSIDEVDSNGETTLFHIFRDHTYDETSIDMMNWNWTRLEQCQRARLSSISCIRHVQLEKLKHLLLLKPDVGIRSFETGDTILHKAIKDLRSSREPRQFGETFFNDTMHANMVGEILKSGLDVNVANSRGETPLSIATSVLSFHVVRALLQNGAEPRDISFANGFAYPQLLPAPEAVDNLMGIAALRGGNLSEEEILAILRFLVSNNVRLLDYANNHDTNAVAKLRNLLGFGTDEIILDSIDRIIVDVAMSLKMLEGEVRRYLVKLRIIGTSPSKVIEECLTRLTRIPRKGKEISRKEYLQFEAEAAMLKATTLKVSGRSLASILRSAPTRAEEKEILRLRHVRFQRDFPHYWSILSGFLAKLLVRRFVVRLMKERIRMVSAKPLPDNCCEMIASYLSNEDLLRLFIASYSQYHTTSKGSWKRIERLPMDYRKLDNFISHVHGDYWIKTKY